MIADNIGSHGPQGKRDSKFKNIQLQVGMPREKVEKLVAEVLKISNDYSPYGNNLRGGVYDYTDGTWILEVIYNSGSPAPWVINEQGVAEHHLPIDETVKSFSVYKKEIITTQNKSLDEKIVKSWGGRESFFIENNFEIIDWEEAKQLLLKEKVRGGKQYHTGWLTIYTSNGDKYLTKQPKMNVLWEFMKEEGLKIEGFGTE